MRRHSEVERGDASPRSHNARELAHGRGGIVDVTHEVREGHVIERVVRERQRLGASAHEGNVSVARRCSGQHVGASVEPDDLAAVAFA